MRLPVGEVFGYVPIASSLGGPSMGFNTADMRMGQRFVLSEDKTLDTIEFPVRVVTGALGANDAECAIYRVVENSANAVVQGTPTGAALATSTTLEAPIGTDVVIKFTGFNLALSAGVQYVAVFRNLNATPAANYWTVFYMSSQTIPGGALCPSGPYGVGTLLSSNGGVTWSGAAAGSINIVLGFSDGDIYGWPQRTNAVTEAWQVIGHQIYGDRQTALRLVLPANVGLRVVGVRSITNVPGGSPTASYLVRIRRSSDDVVLGTTVPAMTNFVNNFAFQVNFGSVIEIPPGSDIRIAAGQSDNSGTAFQYYNGVSYRVRSGYSALLRGNPQESYYDGSSWVDDDTRIPMIGLVLDSEEPFLSAGFAGGSLLNRGLN